MRNAECGSLRFSDFRLLTSAGGRMKHPWMVTIELQLELVPVAQAAYESFRQNEQRHGSAPLPHWLQLPAHTRQAWEEAIMTALRKLASNGLEVQT